MKKCEAGRSMIEMIAVLAIIGVISFGGLWGLNRAFTKIKTNNLIEDVKMGAFTVVDELFPSLPDDDVGLNLADKIKPISSYTFKAFAERETSFEILVENVSYAVCEEIKKQPINWVEEIKANGTSDTCNENDANQISFFFNVQLNIKPEDEGKECRTNKDCSGQLPFCFNGYCAKCEKDADCPSARPYWT